MEASRPARPASSPARATRYRSIPQHGDDPRVAGLLYDYYTLADLKKLQKDFDASERAIAEIYHAKTGLEVDQLRSMMTRETWMSGRSH